MRPTPLRRFVARMQRWRSNPLPPAEYGGFKVGPVFAIGNHLVLTSMHSVDGWASLDIGDPLDPALLARTPDMDLYYAACFNGRRIYAANREGSMVGYDLADPASFEPAGRLAREAQFLYCAMQDDLLVQGGPYDVTTIHVGGARPVKMREFSSRSVGEHAQVAILGNLLYVGDDHGTGSAFFPLSESPDETPPSVVAVSPRDGAVDQAVTSRVGIGFSDSVQLESVSAATARVLDEDGAVVEGTFSGQLGIVNFAPAEPLAPQTTYTLVLAAGGVSDHAGNALAAEFRASFRTGTAADDKPADAVTAATRNAASTVGIASEFAAVEAAGASYAWDFGDGTSSTASTSPTATHTYAAAGHYTVVLTVTVGDADFRYAFVRTAAPPRTSTAPSASTPITGDGALVYNVNPDNGTVTAVDRRGLVKVWETRVGRGPRTLALDAAGRVWVAVREDDRLVCLDGDGVVQAEIDLGHGRGPHGIAFVPGTNTGLVTLQHSGEVLAFDAASARVLRRAAVNGQPRGIAVSADGQAYVTRLRSTSAGLVTKVDSATLATVAEIELAADTTTVDDEAQARGRPNYLNQIVVSPDGGTAWVPAKKDNVLRGVRRDGLALTHDSTVRAMTGVVDLASAREAVGRRIDFNDREGPHAAAFSPLGDYVFVAMRGSNTVEIVDAYSGSHKGGMRSGGKAPQGIWIDAAGRQAFV